MTRHRTPRPAKCGWRRKLRWPTEYDADRAIEQAMEARPDTQLRSYWCTWCDGWHLTHQPIRQ
jgi:hypothetical protein